MEQLGEPLIAATFAFLLIVLGMAWLAALWHCIANEHLTPGMRILYLVMMVVLGPVGSFVYVATLSGSGKPRHTAAYIKAHHHHHHHASSRHLPLPH